jgi:ABC-type Na+ transport system ATPase subunit NatA
MSNENDIREDVEEAVAEAKDKALKSPIVRAILIVATILSMGGVATVKTFQQEIVDMVCETEIKNAELQKDLQMKNIVTERTMHLSTCEKVKVCYETGALMMGISTEHCQNVERLSIEESNRLLEDLAR